MLGQSFTIEKLTEPDLEPAIRVLQQSWLDTYVNEELGITRAWIEEYRKSQLTLEKVALRRGKLQDTNAAGWVAKDSAGNIIGVTGPYKDEQGVQHVGSLYVDKAWHGRGVGGALMKKVIEWFDDSKPIELGVATYNQRAKAFYRKWGFEEVPNSESLYAGKIPDVRMVRRATDERSR